MMKSDNEKIRLKDMSLDELIAYFESIGEKPYKAKQVFKWLLAGAPSFDTMTDLRKDLRERLTSTCVIDTLVKQEVLVSKIDGTRKYLLRTFDGLYIETVLMEYYYGYSICISTQAGCRMGCKFCASGMHGLQRSLTTGEIVDQFVICERDVRENSEIGAHVKELKHTGDGGEPRIGHIVMMGVGEPFDNYENSMKAIKNLTDPLGRNLGRRQITVSTCGLIPEMKRFMEDLPQCNLSVSLHASNDDVRRQIMPVGAKYGVDEIIEFATDYFAKTGRRFTFEYALFDGINDDIMYASELADKVRDKGFHVNLIPGNTVKELGFKTSSPEAIRRFAEALLERGVRTTTRRSLGADILASCGQLRSEKLQEEQS